MVRRVLIRRNKHAVGNELRNKVLDGSKATRLVNLSILLKSKIGQFRIQQMAFMIVALFFFFILAGLFFLTYQYGNVQKNYEDLQGDLAISSLSVIANLPELYYPGDCIGLCIDADKLEILPKITEYKEIWPVASIKVYKIWPEINQTRECPAVDCNFYNIYDSKQKNVKEYATLVSLCRKMKENGIVYDKCEIAKLLAGVKLLA